MAAKIINILVDNDSWILPYASRLENELKRLGFQAQLVRDSTLVVEGWANFMLGCVKLVPPEVLKKNRHNLVVHESDLPKGRGFAPMTWQILDGCSDIPICLLEAGTEPDSGVVWIRDSISLNGAELCSEWRAIQGSKTVELCLRFVHEYDVLVPQEQTGSPTWCHRRRPEDSRMDPSLSIESQFNLLRVVDNEKYPAYFDFRGRRFFLKIFSSDSNEE